MCIGDGQVVALVIGAACAETFQKQGCRVVVADINQATLSNLERETGMHGIVMDVSDYASVESACRTVEAEIGPVDILVNNAGITRDGFMHKMDSHEQWQSVIDVNLTGVFNTCRVIAPGMRERGFGRIVNISSMNGQRGQFGQAN